jgi:hypothetical protein
MTYTTTLLSRHDGVGTLFTQEALEKLAQQLLSKGSLTITDPCGTQHTATVMDAIVDARGLVAVMALPDTHTKDLNFGMGCKVKE